MFNPLINRIRTGRTEEFEPTGWARVDRVVGELRDRLASAATEEQFQAVSLLCREALISVAQAVYVAESHPPLDGVLAEFKGMSFLFTMQRILQFIETDVFRKFVPDFSSRLLRFY